MMTRIGYTFAFFLTKDRVIGYTKKSSCGTKGERWIKDTAQETMDYIKRDNNSFVTSEVSLWHIAYTLKESKYEYTQRRLR